MNHADALIHLLCVHPRLPAKQVLAQLDISRATLMRAVQAAGPAVVARGMELPQRTYAPTLPLPSERSAWEVARHAALLFWEQASGDGRISAAFRTVCAQNAARLQVLG